MNHLSLFELTQIIRNTMEQNLAPSYWIVAEISELRINQKGHCYLELVEKSEDELLAKTRATIWAYNYRNLSTWFHSMTGSDLVPGMKILANVQVQFHELYGFSLNIRDIDPNYTLGEKERKKQEVINQLIKDGVFNLNKSLPLPRVPQHIAVISSPTAAGYGDFLNQLQANPYGYIIRTKLYKSLMQGPEAEDSIINALLSIHDILDHYDLVVIIRGGGSQVDLDCFNNYNLAAHVAQFPLPIVTGIGHERDETITDLVAHTKLKTPTAVSEFLISAYREFESYLKDLAKALVRVSTSGIEQQLSQIENYTTRIKTSVKEFVNNQDQHLMNLGNQLKNGQIMQIKSFENKLILLENSLHLLDPDKILERGYTFSTIKGKPIHKQKGIAKGDVLKTKGKNITVTSTVEQYKHE